MADLTYSMIEEERMSQSWPVVALGEVIAHRKEFIEILDLEQYKRCRVQLHAKGIVLRDVVSGADIRTKRQQVYRTGEFLVAEIDAKLGGFGIVPTELESAIVSSHYFLFTLNEAKLERSFLDYYIRTAAFQDQVTAQGSTNYAAIRPQHVLEYTIPLPPLDEQRRIVARIETLAGRVAEAQRLRTEAMAEVEALTTSVMQNMFTSVSGIQEVNLEDVCELIIDCLHSTPRYADDGIPTVRSPDVGWGTLDLDNARRTDEDEYIHRTQRGAPQVDDIIFVREGGGVGKAAIVSEGQKFSLGQRTMMMRPNKNVVLPRFFLYQLLSPVIYQDQILTRLKGSASPHLNIATLRKFSFLLPDLTEQMRTVNELDNLRYKLDSLHQLQSATQGELETLLPAILDKAFRGEL